MTTGNEVKAGSLITVTFEEREFQAIVIDPNGLGQGEPSIGFGFSDGPEAHRHTSSDPS